MFKSLRIGLAVALSAAALLAAPSAASAADVATAAAAEAAPPTTGALTEVTDFGPNPSGLQMFVYIPASVRPHPAVLVVVHYCTGSAQAMFAGTEFASLADRYGFIAIYPSAPREGHCFDVSSPGALRHDGTSDPVGIVSMVNYALDRYHAKKSQVYVTGASSGAMMTNVLLGDYPDVFAAGSAIMGVPFGCFATTDGSMWNSTCSTGHLIKSAQEWGDLARGASPEYHGQRPRIQLWHGNVDTILAYPNFGEEIKQWTDVLGVSQTPSLTEQPKPTWTHTQYSHGNGLVEVDAYSIAGTGHSLPFSEQGIAQLAIEFFGLDK